MGPPGVGKTSLVRHLDPDSTLFIDVEAGTLSIADVGINMMRPQSWVECRDLAVRVAGVDSAAASHAPYSAQHLEMVGGPLANIDRYKTIFIDSITAVSRLSLRWAETQPEAVSEKSGKKDVRGAYGLHARELLQWLQHWQHAHSMNVILIAVLELRVDEFGQREWRPQIEGAKTAREVGAIVDEVLTMQWIDFGNGKPVRAFVCTQPNQWNYPSKDRSGKLDQFEEPHLARLITKLNGGAKP
jgi:hypothetical protein